MRTTNEQPPASIRIFMSGLTNQQFEFARVQSVMNPAEATNFEIVAELAADPTQKHHLFFESAEEVLDNADYVWKAGMA